MRRRLHSSVLRWFKCAGRPLPWREFTDPYPILVSEVMLQQTQVSRVLVKLPDFLAVFPTIKHLASAQQRSVVTAWKGMGYNNRAVRLHRLAQIVVERHGGKIPGTLVELKGLPGIGRYTAHAFLAFAHRQAVPVVDINIRRLFSRLFWHMADSSALRPESDIWDLSRTLLPRAHVFEWNQALMDLGALVCVARTPRCQVCPLKDCCRSRLPATSVRRRHSRSEPSHRGLPNRVYRGRIVEALRNEPGRLRLAELGKVIRQGFAPSERPWLLRLVAGLERDGLVVVTQNSRSDVFLTLA